MNAPSGEQFEIGAAGQRAVVVEVGGGIRSYTADGEDVLDGYGVDAVAERAPDRVVVENEMHPQPGYPVRVALCIECALSTEGLSIRSTGTNVDDRPCPYGIGAHPYLSVGMPTIDVTTLHVPASTVLLSDGEGIPTGTARVDVMLFSGDPLPDVNWKSLAVEPMTFPPKAFSTGTALVRLQPGEPFTAAWGISPC